MKTYQNLLISFLFLTFTLSWMAYSFLPLLNSDEVDFVELKESETESKSETESEKEFKLEVFFDRNEFTLNNLFFDLGMFTNIHNSDLFICKQSFTEIISPPPEA